MVRGNSLTTFGTVLVVAASISGGWGQERAFETTANCSAPGSDLAGGNWTWMDNAQHKSPCSTAAYLLGPCVSAGYVVTPLPDGHEYTPPAGSFLSLCVCSWAVYNLLNACTLCQGQQNGLTRWQLWTANCGSFTSTTLPYPITTPPDNTTIPYWAGVDPKTWTDQRWNGQQAYVQAVQHPNDIILTDPTIQTPAPKPKSGNNVGAIVGGVMGSVAAIAVGIVLFCRNKRAKNPGSPPPC